MDSVCVHGHHGVQHHLSCHRPLRSDFFPQGLVHIISVCNITLTYRPCLQVCCTWCWNTWWTNTTCISPTCLPALTGKFTWELSIKRWLHQSYAWCGFIFSLCSGQVTSNDWLIKWHFVYWMILFDSYSVLVCICIYIFKCVDLVSSQASWRTHHCSHLWFCVSQSLSA